ncbi:hypothetical protein DFH27DRAFT_526733 [Peziza echinospora]|nr:hypothetical protein DFH27DRAFT_526733 [Peziza echinospora]
MSIFHLTKLLLLLVFTLLTTPTPSSCAPLPWPQDATETLDVESVFTPPHEARIPAYMPTPITTTGTTTTTPPPPHTSPSISERLRWVPFALVSIILVICVCRINSWVKSQQRKLAEETAAKAKKEKEGGGGPEEEEGVEGGVLQMPEDVVVVDGEGGMKRVERVSWVEVGVGGTEGGGVANGVDVPPPAYTSIYTTGRVVA